MPETIYPYPPEFEHLLRKTLAVPEPDPAFMDSLQSQYLAHASLTEKETKMKPRSLPISPRLTWGLVLLFLLVLILAAFSSPDAVNAMRRLLGYIPGVGIVEQTGSVRVLARPVTQTRDGVALTVDQATSQADKTVVIYQYVLDTTILERTPAADANSQASFTTDPALRLPDGTQQKIRRGIHEPDTLSEAARAAGKSAIRYRLEFDALPPNVEHVILLLPRLVSIAPGAGPEFWEVPLDFRASADVVRPVIEIIPTNTSQAQPSSAAPLSSTPSDHGLALVLEKVIPLDDGYVFMGTFQSKNPADFMQSQVPGSTDPQSTYSTLQSFSLVLKDADGRDIPFEQKISTQDTLPHWQSWSLQVKGKDLRWPVSIIAHSMQADITASASFQFDPGPAPQPGQTWTLDQTVEAGGYRIQILSATANTGADNKVAGFRFTLESQDGVFGAILNDLDHPQQGGGGGGGPFPGPFVADLTYADTLPSTPIHVGIQDLSVVFYGTWQASWSPAAGVVTLPPSPTLPPGTALRVPQRW